MSNFNPFMNMSMNNDMLSMGADMFKKTMENMQMWNMSNKNSNFDMNSMMNDAMKNIKEAVAVCNRNNDSVMAIVKRKSDILQRHAGETFDFMKNLSNTSSAEEVLAKQADFMKEMYNNVMSDFKELCEMYSKSSMETFEGMSKKMSNNMQEYQEVVKKTAGKAASK